MMTLQGWLNEKVSLRDALLRELFDKFLLIRKIQNCKKQKTLKCCLLNKIKENRKALHESEYSY